MMGTLTPNSTIYCLQGVPLDNTYAETYYKAFDGTKTYAQNQQALVNDFLNNFSYQTYAPHTYQRVQEGVLRVADVNTGIADISFLSKCNYMIFKNDATFTGVTPIANRTYEDKYYFAFITNVEYVNENAVNIYYEIDVMLTYIFDYWLEPCLVERQHSTSDNIGEHTQPEPIETGDIICMYMTGTSWFNDTSIVLGRATPSEPPSE